MKTCTALTRPVSNARIMNNESTATLTRRVQSLVLCMHMIIPFSLTIKRREKSSEWIWRKAWSEGAQRRKKCLDIKIQRDRQNSAICGNEQKNTEEMLQIRIWHGRPETQENSTICQSEDIREWGRDPMWTWCISLMLAESFLRLAASIWPDYQSLCRHKTTYIFFIYVQEIRFKTIDDSFVQWIINTYNKYW